MRSCLIVDDNPTIRLAIGQAIRAAQKGVDIVHEAETSESALQLFDEHAPDIVFLDMTLASEISSGLMQGLGVLRKMLASRPETPVVVLTGGAGLQPGVADAISMGAVAALRKPLRAEEIKFVLDTISPDAARMDYFA